MDKYDVVVVGAGPAGGQCARSLSSLGYCVLLVDKAKNFWENNYSSGGTPLETMQDFALPESVVGSYWNSLRIQSTQERSFWLSPTPFGSILDFDKLRAFLAQEVIELGGTFRLACQYHSHHVNAKFVEVLFKERQTEEWRTVQAKVLVDATGSDRKVLVKPGYDKKRGMAATGIEYHVRVQPAVYQQFSQALNFFLGHHWMPQGYAWIFPMSSNQLKVGVIRYFQNEKYVAYDPSYNFYLNRLLQLCGPASSYQIVDRHGRTILYTWGQKDQRHQGPVLAIGDAISAINPLGWEGIRHALFSGREAACQVDCYLQKKSRDFSNYGKAMQRYFGWKWFYSELLMKSLFRSDRDELIDRSVRFFGLMDNEEIMDVIFRYHFRHTLKPYLWYFISRFKHFFSPTKR